MSRPHKGALKKTGEGLGLGLVPKQQRHGYGDSRPRPRPKLAETKSGTKASVRINPTPVCNDEPVTEPVPELPTHEKLLAWSKQIGFVPGDGIIMTTDYPTAEDFKRLCRPDVQPLWDHLAKHARPMHHVAAFRRATQARQQAGQVEWALRRMEGELETKRAEVADREGDVAGLQDVLKKMFLKRKALEEQTEELEMKTLLLTRRASDLRALIEHNRACAEVADSLLPYKIGAGEAEGAGEPRSVGCLRECLVLVGRTHDRHYLAGTASQGAAGGGKVSLHADTAALHRLVAARMREHTAAEVWAGLRHLREEFRGELGEMERRLGEGREQEEIRETLAAEGVTPMQATLVNMSAMLLRAQCAHRALVERNAQLADALEAARVECLAAAGGRSAALNASCLPDDRLVEEWLAVKVECELRKAEQAAIKEEIRKLQEEGSDLSELQLKMDASRERIGRVRQELRSCNERLDHDMPCLRGAMGKLHAMQTALADQTEAFSRDAGGRDARQLVASSQGLAYAEVREVVELPLEALHAIPKPTGETALKRDLLTRYASSLSSLSNDHGSVLDQVLVMLDGAPQLPVEEVLLGMYEKRKQLTRFELALSETRPVEPIDGVDVAALAQHVRTLDSRHSQDLAQAAQLLSGALGHAAQLPRLVQLYAEHPAWRLVPREMVAGGRTLAEWQREYEDLWREGEAANLP